MWWPHLLLLLSIVSTAFGNSLQPISILAWLQPLLLLLATDGYLARRGTVLCVLSVTVVEVVCHAAATTFAFAGLLKDPHYTMEGICQVFAVAAALWLGLVVIAVWGFLSFRSRYPTSSSLPLVFPVLWTAVWVVVGLTPLGSTLNPAYALLDYQPLVQVRC